MTATISSPFDPLDYQIIQQLRQDGRLSASQVARRLKANERTIRKRIDRLIELGAIRCAVIIEPKAFGYGISVDIFLEIAPSLENQIIDQLLGMPEISYLAYGQGSNDLSIEARFKDSEAMYTFLRQKLPAIAGLIVKGYALVPRILRNIDEWMPPPLDFGVKPADMSKSN